MLKLRSQKILFFCFLGDAERPVQDSGADFGRKRGKLVDSDKFTTNPSSPEVSDWMTFGFLNGIYPNASRLQQFVRLHYKIISKFLR
jgi:hypothetical protein